MIVPVVAALVAALAGHPVPVRCDFYPGSSGWTSPAGVVHIFRPFCTDLARLKRTHVASELSGPAVLAVTHEAMHASGRPHARNETLTECRAIRYARRTARLLGLTTLEIRRLWPSILAEHRYVRTFKGYHDFACGGGLELR